jgi:hypothetical protein
VVAVIGLVDPVNGSTDTLSGLLCTARLGDQEIELPLAELKLEEGGNHRLIEDYWYWLWNWQ